MDTVSLYPTPAPRAPELTIRRVKGIDAPAVAELRALSSGSHRAPDRLFTLSVRAWLEAEGEARITLVASIQSRAIGMISLLECRGMPLPDARSSRWGHLDHLFVREDERRRGVGTALIEEATAIADRRDYQRLLVSPNSAALPLFDRLGFLLLDELGPRDIMLVRPSPRG